MTDTKTMEQEASTDTTIQDAVRRSREQIPVRAGTGLSPEQMAQLVDAAKTMAQSRFSLPEHLQGNPGDCFAVLNLATRTGMDAYFIGQHTYVQNNRLCLMSVLYHGLALASGYLAGPLRDTYEGEGNEMTCTVEGRIKGEPIPYVLTSEPLGNLHPGHVEKDGKRFSKGSPLWDKKPQQQLFYNTARDWVRKYAPLAILGGMMPQDEMEDMVDVTPQSGLVERLNDPERPQTGEGFQDGSHLSVDLPTETVAEEVEASAKSEGRRVARQITNGRKKAKPGTKTPPRAKASQRARQPEPEALPKPKPKPSKIAQPQPWAEYVTATEAWIGSATNAVKAENRWDKEFDLRDELAVPIAERTRLRGLLDEKIKSLS